MFREIFLWDTHTGELRGVWQGQDGVLSIDFSPDGRWLASGGRLSDVWIWDVSTGTAVNKIDNNPNVVNDHVGTLIFSPDGTRLAVGSFRCFIQMYDVSSWQPLWQYSGEELTRAFENLAFSPDGSVLYSTKGGTLRLLDAQTGQVLNTLYQGGEREIFAAMVLNPAGDMLVTMLIELDEGYNVVNTRMDLWAYNPAGAVTEPAPVEPPAQPTEMEGLMTTAAQNANLRGGPGTRITSWQCERRRLILTVIGQNAAADWYQLSVESLDNAWIAGFLVNPPTCPAGFTLPTVG